VRHAAAAADDRRDGSDAALAGAAIKLLFDLVKI
jgi:hypothetical protein